MQKSSYTYARHSTHLHWEELDRRFAAVSHPGLSIILTLTALFACCLSALLSGYGGETVCFVSFGSTAPVVPSTSMITEVLCSQCKAALIRWWKVGNIQSVFVFPLLTTWFFHIVCPDCILGGVLGRLPVFLGGGINTNACVFRSGTAFSAGCGIISGVCVLYYNRGNALVLNLVFWQYCGSLVYSLSMCLCLCMHSFQGQRGSHEPPERVPETAGPAGRERFGEL